jgi:ankyrin repeat protein
MIQQRHSQVLAIADWDGNLPLHQLLYKQSSSIDAVLQMIKLYPAALQHQTNNDQVPLHIECKVQCRSAIVIRCIELYPQALAIADKSGYLPLHRLLGNKFSSMQDALMMIELYPAAIEHQNVDGYLPLHFECIYQRRYAIISKYFELYPQALATPDNDGFLPLHRLLLNQSSSIDDALITIEQYPEAIQHQNRYRHCPLHIESRIQCRPAIISKCVEIYPEALAIADRQGCLPLHYFLGRSSSSIDMALMMIEKYPASLQHQNLDRYLPLHLESMYQCRLPFLSKCMEKYLEALGTADSEGCLPLHRLFLNLSSPIDIALMMIERHPVALKHQNHYHSLPLHIESKNRCRSVILRKCIELYPEGLDDKALTLIIPKIYASKDSFQEYLPVSSLIYAARPASLYDRQIFMYIKEDIRDDPYYRRRILNLLPLNVFTPTHEANYRELNWQPRCAMIMLLSRIQRTETSDHLHRSAGEGC